MKHFLKGYLIGFLILLFIPFSYLLSDEQVDPVLWKKAMEIHKEAIVIDTHCDTAMMVFERNLDIGKKSDMISVDLIKMKEGELDAIFFAVFISNDLDNKNPSRKTLDMIDEIYNQVDRYPSLAKMAFSPNDIRDIHSSGKRAILIGIENGGPIEKSFRLLRNFYRLGVRYITLTHNSHNQICDSSSVKKPKWNGLSPFGKEVVKEMNRLGMIIDVSHISDKAFADVLEISKAPVMASHSCARAICNVSRNMSDSMIRALAKKGGVIQITFYSGFVDPVYNKKAGKIYKKIGPERKKLKEKYKDNINEYYNVILELWKKVSPPAPKIETLIDHIDHVVKLVGIDYVGLGSDYDGASSYPVGLEDVSGFPLISYHLLKRGYRKEEIIKILGGNFLRVFDKVVKTSESLKSLRNKP
jgi:membrane dipeptidase